MNKMEEKEKSEVLVRARPMVRAFDLSTEGRVLSSFSDETIKIMAEESGSKLISAMVTDMRARFHGTPNEVAFHADWSLSW